MIYIIKSIYHKTLHFLLHLQIDSLNDLFANQQLSELLTESLNEILAH